MKRLAPYTVTKVARPLRLRGRRESGNITPQMMRKWRQTRANERSS